MANRLDETLRYAHLRHESEYVCLFDLARAQSRLGKSLPLTDLAAQSKIGMFKGDPTPIHAARTPHFPARRQSTF